MKKIFLILLVLSTIFLAYFCLSSCKMDMQDEANEQYTQGEFTYQYENHGIVACGVKDPLKNFSWLKELTVKAKNDNTGNYIGVIWLEKIEGKDVFVTNMMLGSGGVMYWFYDCSGNRFVPDVWKPMKPDVAVYANLPNGLDWKEVFNLIDWTQDSK